MILLDLNQVMISNLMQQIGNHKNTKIELNLVRHMVLNSIRANNVKFRSDFGEMVICCDDKNYWRKEIFPYYKALRKEDQKKSEVDWTEVFKCLNTIREELKEYFPYRVIQIDHAEADDVIASICFEFEIGEDIEHEILILSGDKDFQQLQCLDHVKQYDPIRKTWLKCKNPEEFLWEHIIKGDRGDGIPNIRSSESCLVERVRQKPVTQKKLDQWLPSLVLTGGNPESVFDEEEVKRYKKNEKLIDLRNIPNEIRQQVLEKYYEQGGKSKIKLQNYFIKFRLKQLNQHYSEF